MSYEEFQSRNTNLQIYQLIHDPVQLRSLLFLKYGLVTQDFFISYINQLLFNNISHHTIAYKEQIYNLGIIEYIKKIHNYNSSKELIKKISIDNKNYIRFFSKPVFNDFYFNACLGSYYDKKAEVFYFNDYSGKKNTKILRENELKNAINYDISSFDNDTQVSIIFNQRMRKMIDNNLGPKDLTLSLTEITKKENNDTNKNNNTETLNNTYDNLFDQNAKKANIDTNKQVIKEKDNKTNIIKNEYNIENIESIEQNNIKKIKLPIYINNINRNLKNIKHINIPNQNKGNNNLKEKTYFESLDINNKKNIDKKSLDLNIIKNFSPFYKKPKLIISNKFSKQLLSEKQTFILHINPFKKSKLATKNNNKSPQSKKLKYIFKDFKKFISRKIESPKRKKDESKSDDENIFCKQKFPSINREHSVIKFNSISELLSSNKGISKIKLNIYPFKNGNLRMINKSPINKINTPQINLGKLSFDLKGISQVKNMSSFSRDKMLDNNTNIININKKRKNFNHIKNNYFKKLRPSYSMNKEIESFNSDCNTIDINNKVDINMARNIISKNKKPQRKNFLVKNKKEVLKLKIKK